MHRNFGPAVRVNFLKNIKVKYYTEKSLFVRVFVFLEKTERLLKLPVMVFLRAFVTQSKLGHLLL